MRPCVSLSAMLYVIALHRRRDDARRSLSGGGPMERNDAIAGPIVGVHDGACCGQQNSERIPRSDSWSQRSRSLATIELEAAPKRPTTTQSIASYCPPF